MEVEGFSGNCRLGLEQGRDELHRLVKVLPALVVGVLLRERELPQLFAEEVAFVKEDDHRRVHKELVVADLLEQPQRLVHAVGGVVLVERLVVLAQRDHKDHGRHVLEAVDPLPPLVPLPAHVHEAELGPAHLELGLVDPGGPDASDDDVLQRWLVVGLCDAVDVVKEAIKQ